MTKRATTLLVTSFIALSSIGGATGCSSLGKNAGKAAANAAAATAVAVAGAVIEGAANAKTTQEGETITKEQRELDARERAKREAEEEEALRAKIRARKPGDKRGLDSYPRF